MKRTRKFGFLGTALVLLLIGTLLPLRSPQLALGYAGGLDNPGFEEGALGWDIGPAPDCADIVEGSEGADLFPAYADMGDVTVSPFSGNKMLRLGSPKGIKESQNSGLNTISQTFTPDSDTLVIAFRLFSWEHRGYDFFSFDLTNQFGESVGTVTDIYDSDLIITMPDGATENLSASRSCTLDIGKRGQYLDTGWVRVKISDIPLDGDLTLSYSVGGTDNEAHGTWAYFDYGNSPPVAKFSFGPLQPFEGDIVQILDGSYDPDPGDRIVSWEWDVTWSVSTDNVWHSYSTVRNPFFVPPDEDDPSDAENWYSISLKVTDTWGDSTTITNGEVPVDGYLYYPADDPPNVPFEPLDHAVPLLHVENAPPMVNALDIEALPGQAITLIGRFLDPGWTDTHTANWTITSEDITVNPETAELLEDDSAYLETGIAVCEATVSDNASLGDYTGTLTVTDNDGGTSSDNFTISVVADDPQRREPNNTPPAASQVYSDGVYLSYVQSMGDIDLFEVTLPGGQTLPAGSEILVTLKGLSADYDLVMFNESPATAPFQRSPFQRSPFQMSPFQRSPFQRSPFQMSPFQRSDYQGTPFQRSPFQRSPFQRSPFQRSPFQRSPFQRSPFQRSPFQRSTFDQYPLSDVGYTGLDAANIGGTDISLSELGLGYLAEDLTPIGFSANRGLGNETLLVRSELDGTRFFIAVFGVNEVFSEEPYLLQIETSRPLDLTGWLGDEGFSYNAPVDNWDNSDLYVDNFTPAVITDNETPLTLFVTQRERMQGLYGGNQWDSLASSLASLSQQPAIRGRVISVPIGMYENADLNTDNIAAINELAATIRTIIQNELATSPSIRYIVIVGSDGIVPHYRVPDETIISNERAYLMSSFVTPGSPLFYSMLGGWNLTDDYYVDEAAIPWQGRSLYMPDLAIGRLVETPEEIMAAADAFITSGGVLQADTALVTGYDFFRDGSIALADIVGADSELISDNWSSDDLRFELLSSGYDVSAINAHFAHYAALSALGFNTDNMSDVLTSEEVALASGDPMLYTLVMSMGCHAGLNVTDNYSDGADEGLGVNPALDFPQAMAQQRAIYVASTGYGLGDDEGIGGTELLINIFAESLMTDGVPVGESLVLAKQRYLGGLSTMTVYDEKSSIQFTLYGLPQYEVSAEAEAASASTVESALSRIASAGLATSSDNVTLTAQDLGLEPVVTDSGIYYTANGTAQATAFRPVQPRLVLPIENSSDNIVHGVILQGGLYDDEFGFDPVITRPTNEWEAEVSELQIPLPALWPATLASVNTLETGEEAIQNLVILAGQFQPTGFSDNSVIGVQRLYTNLHFELLRSTSDDFEPPVIGGIDLRLAGNTVTVGVAASDPSGIARIVVLTFHEGTVTPTELVVSGLPSSDYFTVDVPVPGGTDYKMIIQVVDGEGNVAAATGRGAYLNAIAVDVGPDRSFGSYYPVTFTARISDFASLTENGTAPVFYIWKFGDNTTTSGLLPANHPVDENGDVVFSVQHTYYYADNETTTSVTATLKVLDMNGGIGVDDVTLHRIWDPQGDAWSTVVGALPNADLVGGYVTNDGETMTIGLRVSGNVTDSTLCQYRVRLTPESGGGALIKYDGGISTGPPSLEAALEWNEHEQTNELKLMFDLDDIGLESGELVWLYFETQAGVPGTGQTGFVDRMPDSGSFLYVVR